MYHYLILTVLAVRIKQIVVKLQSEVVVFILITSGHLECPSTRKKTTQQSPHESSDRSEMARVRDEEVQQLACFSLLDIGHMTLLPPPICGHHMYLLAMAFILTMPGYSRCNSSNIWFCNFHGITTCVPHITHDPSTVSSWCLFQYDYRHSFTLSSHFVFV